MIREIMQQALTVLKAWDALIKYQYGGSSEAMTAMQNVAWRTLDTIEGLEAALAQPEQEEPLPLVDIGVDVTPEGTHVVACYNKPDAVQEMFYSQFHPLAKPEQSKYSDIVSDGGLDPRNKFDAQPEQEPVCDKDPFYCWSIRCQVGKVCKHTAPPKREWVGLTVEEIRLMAHNDDKGDWNDLRFRSCWHNGYVDGVNAANAKLKELNK
jgi:hypothetical protein